MAKGYNPYRDKKTGEFTTGSGGGAKSKPAAKSKAAASAVKVKYLPPLKSKRDELSGTGKGGYVFKIGGKNERISETTFAPALAKAQKLAKKRGVTEIGFYS